MSDESRPIRFKAQVMGHAPGSPHTTVVVFAGTNPGSLGNCGTITMRLEEAVALYQLFEILTSYVQPAEGRELWAEVQRRLLNEGGQVAEIQQAHEQLDRILVPRDERRTGAATPLQPRIAMLGELLSSQAKRLAHYEEDHDPAECDLCKGRHRGTTDEAPVTFDDEPPIDEGGMA